jgi:hypothetical protein
LAYAIYLNDEGAQPKFEGTLGVFRVFPLGDPNERPAQECPGGTMEPLTEDHALHAVTFDADMRIPLARLPQGITPVMAPDVWDCDGAPAATKWNLQAAAGTPGVNKGGTGLTIARTRHRDVLVYAASARRWHQTTVAGLPAAVVDPIVQQSDIIVGDCAAAALDGEKDILTQVHASSATAAFCISILEAVLAP